MTLKKIFLSLILCLLLIDNISVVNASPKGENLNQIIDSAVEGTTFNGSIMISRSSDEGYDILYQNAIGTSGGYDVNTLYDIGSISKVYTATAIMLLEEEGKINFNDKISKYIPGVPSDKENVTIKMLLTHSSGINAPENPNHLVSLDEEVKRILKSPLSFNPGDGYVYSNSGFTLLAVIIENASSMPFEEYVTKHIFAPLELTATGFPNSAYLKDKMAVDGSLNGENYGKVTDFDFGWYSKGYTDIITSPKELTFFFQELFNGKIINKRNLKLLSNGFVKFQNNNYRTYGAELLQKGSEKELIGHTGVWYGGNSVAYYRPKDNLLFVLAADNVEVGENLPANKVFYKLNAELSTHELDETPSVETVSFKEMDPIKNALKRNGSKTQKTKLLNVFYYRKNVLLSFSVLAIFNTIILLGVRLKRKELKQRLKL